MIIKLSLYLKLFPRTLPIFTKYSLNCGQNGKYTIYIVEIIYRTREDPRVKVGSSPRGAQSLFKLSRALAVLSGRDYVIPDDIKRLSIYTLRHRIILKPEPRIKGVKTEEIVSEILEQVEVPTTQGQLED